MSWNYVKLSSIVLELESGSRPKGGSLSAGLVSVGGTQISNDGGFKWENMDYVPESFYEKLKNGIVQTNDILIVKDGATTGKVAFVDGDFPFEKASINEHVFRISVDLNQADPKFIFYYLFTPTGQTEIQKDFRGATVGGISRQFTDFVTIPLPDLRTQQQIVAVLDKAQSLIRKREQSIQLLDELLKSTFLDMFGDPVLNEKGWELTTLSNLGKWHSGGTPLRSIDKYFKGSIPWYSSGELNNVYTSESKEKISLEAIKETSAKLIEEGSLLIGMYDTAALKSSITTEKSSCNQAIAFAKLDDKKCSTLYTYYAIQIGREHYLTQRRGVRQRNLNLSMVKNFELPLPKITLQIEFETKVLKIFNLKNKITTGLVESNNLFQSLLQDAFAGKLKLEEDLPLDVILEQYLLGDTNQQEKERNQELIQLLANSTEKLAAFKTRLDKQEFENIDEYEKSKAVLFEVLNTSKSKLEQGYDKKNNKLELIVK